MSPKPAMGPAAAKISSEPDGPPLTLNQTIADIATKPSTRLRSGCAGSKGLPSSIRLAAPGAVALGSLAARLRSSLAPFVSCSLGKTGILRAAVCRGPRRSSPCRPSLSFRLPRGRPGPRSRLGLATSTLETCAKHLSDERERTNERTNERIMGDTRHRRQTAV